MKKDLYILGNGFDLFLGFKTTYKNFIDANNFETHRNDLRVILDEFRNSLPSINDFYVKQYINRRLNSLEKDPKHGNLFLRYLLLSRDYQYEHWYEVESKILKYVSYLSCLAEKTYDNFKNTLSIENLSKDNFIAEDHLINCFFIFLFERKDITADNYKDKLFEELQEFEKMFGEYIKKECSLDNRNKAFNNIDKIFTAEKMMTKFVIFNFNYSTYLKQYLHFDEDTMVNIHGNTDNPIFGIDFEENKGDELAEEFDITRYTKASRIFMDTTIQNEFNLPSKDEIENIYFFGHSLSKADYSYFQTIFDSYDLYHSNIQLHFLYTEYAPGINVRKIQHDAIMKLLKIYGDTFENKHHGRNLITKLLMEKRIHMKKVSVSAE